MNFRSVVPSLYRRARRVARNMVSEQRAPRLASAQLLDEATFLALFDLELVAAALQRGDIPAAQEALLAHYAQRISDDWPATPSDVPDLDTDLARLSEREVLALAEQLLAHRMKFGQSAPEIALGAQINWHTQQLDDREWALTLHRHQWWLVLARAYSITGDERYANDFVAQFTSWVEQCPMPPSKREDEPSWRLMEVAMRMYLSWTHAFAAFFHAPVFTPAARLTMLRAIYDHAQFLTAFKSRGNHLIRESKGLAYIGTYFPEFREAGAWLQLGLTRFRAELDRQVNQDGFQSEVSTGYQWLVVDEYRRTYDYLTNDSPVITQRELGQRLVQMYSALAYLTRPDGTYPQINDGVMDPDFMLHDRLLRAGELFERADLCYIASQGRSGSRPEQTSMAFPDGGLFVMRSDWTTDARYLLFDAGPFGGNHGHEDKLSIEVYAYGQPFIVDPGSYTYATDDPYRAYFVGSYGHNTILCDGKSQIRRWQPGAHEHAATPGNYATWRSTPAYDSVVAEYQDGYGEYSFQGPFEQLARVRGVTHRRQVLFVKPDYWLIIDDLDTAEPHQYALLFHSMPGMEAVIDREQRVMLTAPGGAQLLVAPAQPHSVSVEVVAGSEQPIQGWYSTGYYHKAAVPTVIYQHASLGPTRLVTLLYPQPAGATLAGVTIEQLPATSGLAFTIATPGQRDEIALTPDGDIRIERK